MLQLNKNKEGVGSMNIKKWSVSPLDKARAAKIAEEMQYPSFLAMMLEIRGFHTKDDIDALFDVSKSFADPFLMKDMDCAVARIQRAIENFETICVYGDYDADGVTSTAMLYSYLESCGANVMFYIPLREQEGYGLNLEALDQLHEQGVQLIVTVDNGIASIDEVAYASQLGMDVVITDHHRPREILPKAVAVVDPHRVDCTYPFKDLSGVGVAFKLITALEGEIADMTTLLENYADFVAVGTIGDIVSLTGENRALVQAGLPLLSHSDRPGICALLEQASMSGKELSSTNVAFTIVPRINATGRIVLPADLANHSLSSPHLCPRPPAAPLYQPCGKRASAASFFPTARFRPANGAAAGLHGITARLFPTASAPASIECPSAQSPTAPYRRCTRSRHSKASRRAGQNWWDSSRYSVRRGTAGGTWRAPAPTNPAPSAPL